VGNCSLIWKKQIEIGGPKLNFRSINIEYHFPEVLYASVIPNGSPEIGKG
jgi:hypothetical protein